MANPQIENGYTKIANELLEAICRYMTNPSWLRLSFLIIRLTYGWGRKEVTANTKSLSTKIGITEEYVKSILVELEHAKIIKLEPVKPSIYKITFNKDYDKWTIRH